MLGTAVGGDSSHLGVELRLQCLHLGMQHGRKLGAAGGSAPDLTVGVVVAHCPRGREQLQQTGSAMGCSEECSTVLQDCHDY